VKGVTDVVTIPNGVAVLAKDFWTAKKGRDALKIDVGRAPPIAAAATPSSPLPRAGEDAGPRRAQGRRRRSGAERAGKVIEAEFAFPFLAHASMEPLNCVMKLDAAGCEVWNGEQLHTGDQFALAKMFGLKLEQVKLNTVFAGGSFGRRANPQSDYLLETAQIVKAIKRRAPVKLVWTREDDMRGGYYRPIYLHRVRAALDAEGHAVAGSSASSASRSPPVRRSKACWSRTASTCCRSRAPPRCPTPFRTCIVDLHTTNADVRVPVQWWRSVGSTHTGFSTEVFIDELAAAAGKDPVAYRMALLEKHPRHAGVLKLAADKAGWDKPLSALEGRREARSRRRRA
jgi:isoquinoline 1-oxidoreductase beta subunit